MNLVTCYEPGVSYKEMPCEKLEPCEGKLSRTVLRGGTGSNVGLLPDPFDSIPNKHPLLIATLFPRVHYNNHQTIGNLRCR